jgi:POT family proton-dependent oligopeptide transporter
MGTNFLAMGLGGALSGIVYTSLYGVFNATEHPEYTWFVLAAHMVLGIIAMNIFTRSVGEFTELDE